MSRRASRTRSCSGLGRGRGRCRMPVPRWSRCSGPRPRKILVIVGGLWLVLSAYRDVVPAAFFTAFVITVIVFSMAFFVRD